MINKIIHKLLEQRHYWRTVSFSELAELYASRLMRLMAVNMVSGMTGVYLYQLGYPLIFIVGFFAMYFALRGAMTIPCAYLIARIGPKHSILISNLLYVPALLSLTQLSSYGLPILGLFALFQATSVALYNTAYFVDFSKIQHREHAGKEIGFMSMVEKIGAGLSPFVGGVVAYVFAPEMTMWAAAIVFIVAAGPLFFSPEPVRTHQNITFRGFNWRATSSNFVSQLAVGVDQVSSAGIWVLYAALTIFGTTSNIVYAQVGALTSIAFVASLGFSRLYGLVVDRNRGGDLLTVSVIGDAIVHLSRPFITTPLGVVTTNIANEAATTGYSMPYMKGEFDMADSLPGYRIVYAALMDVALCAGATFFCLLMGGVLILLGGNEVRGLQIGYIIAAICVLPMLLHGFPALKRRRLTLGEAI